ncbi:hypothetical protein ACFOOK_26515 [Micromonospora krabiensis]|uniref:hypothetical protein n=1 Tax=Micromonospora krabiensis TaxID=307121 RepID=UPI000B867210|nr:hypothetical protein [Micromonospora krabiensis]
MKPKSGDTLHVGAECSVQFAGPRALIFRFIRVLDWPTYDGWVWLDGYSLDARGNALHRRSIYVMPEGLRLIAPPRPQGQPARRRPIARTPVRVG